MHGFQIPLDFAEAQLDPGLLRRDHAFFQRFRGPGQGHAAAHDVESGLLHLVHDREHVRGCVRPSMEPVAKMGS
jgi:hypothetical protein